MWRHDSRLHFKCKANRFLLAPLKQKCIIDSGMGEGKYDGMSTGLPTTGMDDDFDLSLALDDSPPDPQARDYNSINYHLHLADELVEWVKRAIDSGEATKFTGNTFRNLEEHMQILEGSHPRQERHMPKPEHWQPDQLDRLKQLKQFIDETRPRLAAILQPSA